MPENMLDKMREVLLLVAAAVAFISVFLAVYEGMYQRFLSATFLAGLFIACTFIVFLPKLELLKAFGVEARLQQKLNEAEEILAQLRRLAIINAKSAYLNVGKGGRWTEPNTAEKQEMLDEIESHLKTLNVPEHERRALASTYLKLMGFDFYMLYINTLERYFQFKQQDVIAQLNKNPDDATIKSELDRWRQGTPAFKSNRSLYSQLDSYSLEDEMNRLNTSWLSESDQKAVQAFRNKSCRSSMSYGKKEA